MSVLEPRINPRPDALPHDRHGLHIVEEPFTWPFLFDSKVRFAEPLRDWSLGFITGHRSRIVVCMSTFIAGLYLIQHYLWPKPIEPTTTSAFVVSLLSVLWIMSLPAALFGLIGMLAYRHSKNLDEVTPILQTVVFRICSKGDNIEMVISTIDRCIKEMTRTPLFDYLVEVVINDVPAISKLPQGDRIQILVIPDAYQTARGDTKYKARGLQYALEYSEIPETAWLVHLDEETQPTSSGIKGIAKMINEEEESGKLRIGQGAILYHRNWKTKPFWTLADNVRTGDDFARFYAQHRIGQTIFGLHGSYIVVRNDVEKRVGFDFGPHGSITEDAFWAVRNMEDGVRARWCEGYLEEQSTEGLNDFLKQRARWFQGLWIVSFFAPVKLRWRLSILVNTVFWMFAPLAGLYTVAHFFIGYATPWWVTLMANLTYASFMTLYLTGLKANMDEHKIEGWHRRAGWTIAQIALTPVFSIIESSGVVLGIWQLVKSIFSKKEIEFHVVKKGVAA
ncbi:MAG TPA: glycosyltransferase family 2 protein [Candidatus Microsaccharimonas sp.]|jgi:egghead protein (zeste-white 4 protein)